MNDLKNGIDKRSDLPLYQQLKKIIKNKIEQGELKPGTRIPPEHALCDMFEISRAPVRQALTELVNEGFLFRQQGSGTFVVERLRETAQSMKVVVPEAMWGQYLRKALRLQTDDYASLQISLDVQVSGRPQLHSQLLSAVGRGEAPDIALIDWAWVSEFADLRFLQRIELLDESWANELRADLFPAFVDQRAPALYGVQPEANVTVLWYRKDWFEREGKSPPQTWDELVQVTQHFKRYVGFPLVLAAGRRAGETTTYQLLPFLWSAGGDLLSQGRVTLDERAVLALTFIRDLVHKYRVVSPDVTSYSWDQPSRQFANGKAAMAMGGSYEKPLIQAEFGWDDKAFRDKVGCIPVPAGPNGRQAAVAGGMVYVIFRQSKNPKLALEVLKRVVAPPLMREFCMKTGRSPTRRSVAATLNGEGDWFSHRVSNLLHIARTRMNIPAYARVSEQFQIMIEDAVSARVPPRDAVVKAREIIEVLIGQKRRLHSLPN